MSTVEAPPLPLAATRPLADLLRGAAGFALLGLAAGAGSGDLGIALGSAPCTVFAGLVPAAITTPALLVVHQFLGLDAEPEAIASALAGALARAGRLAAGLSAVVLFFSLTSDLWLHALAASFFFVGAAALGGARRALAGVTLPGGAAEGRAGLLTLAWVVLTAAVGARVAFITGGFLLGL